MPISRRAIRPLLAVGIVSGMTGCVSMSTTQTAQTLRPGESQRTWGAGYYHYEPSTLFGAEEEIEAPYVELGWRQGISDRADWGARVSILGTAVGDVKYQFVDGDRFDAAVGAGAGLMHLRGQDESTTFVDLILPLHVSWEASPRFTPYVSPKFVWRSRSADDGRAQTILGGTLGARLGERRGFYVELSYQNDLRSAFEALQVNVAWFRIR